MADLAALAAVAGTLARPALVVGGGTHPVGIGPVTQPTGLMTDTIYVILNASGSGSANWRAQKTTVSNIVQKITLTCAIAGTGTARLSRDGVFQSGAPFSTYLETRGADELVAGQSLTVTFTGGPPGAAIAVVFHYWERRPDVPLGLASGVSRLEFVSLGTLTTGVAGSSILDSSGRVLAANGVELHGPFSVTSMNNILTRITTRTNGAAVNLSFFADEAMTIGMGFWRMNLLPSAAPAGDGNVNQAWPVLGPWMTCQVTASAIGGINYDIRLSASGTACAPFDSGGRTNLISNESVAIAAAATVTRQAFQTNPGLGFWMAGLDGGTWTAKIEAVNQDGLNPFLIDKGTSADGRIARLVPLCGRPHKISITNTGAAPQLADLSLSVVPQLG